MVQRVVNADLDLKRKRLWLAATVAGLRYLDLVTQKVMDIRLPQLFNESVWNVKLAGDSLCIATLRGLKILDLKSQQVATLFPNTSIRALLVDSSYLWVGTEGNGLARYNCVTKTTTYYTKENGGTNNNDIWALAQDTAHNLWIGTDGGGLNILTPGRNRTRYYMHSEFNERSLSYNTIRSIFIEPNNNVWLGTYNGGVSYYEITPIQFQVYRRDFFNENSLRNNAVSAFAQAYDGTIWVGTDGGGLHYFKDNIVHRYTLPNPLVHVNVIISLQQDGKGLWVGSFQNGLIYLDGKGGWKQFLHDPGDSTSIAANTIWSIQKDSSGYLWIGTNRGVNRFDPRTGIFHHIGNPLQGKINGIFKNVQAQTILISSDQTLWVGSYGLLMAYLPALDSVIGVKNVDANGRSLPDLRVKTLLEDNGKLWIGTYGSGLCQYNYLINSFHILDERDGLPDNIVLSIQKGIEGSLWLSTNKGLVHFNEADTVFTVFDSNYGVQGTTFNRNAALRTSDGRLLFGGTKGFNVFKPARFTDEKKSLNIVFTDFHLFNKQVNPGSAYLKKSITETRQLDLPHSDSRLIALQFSALDFLSPDKVLYSYKLVGFENNWQSIGHDHSVTFTNLDPGTYTLLVRASWNGQTWGPQKSLTIIIQTPWWKTAYFRSLVVVLMLAAVYTFYRYRIYQLAQRKKELELLVDQQSQEIRNQNDDLGAQNEELKAQNEEVITQQKMITSQNLLLHNAKQELEAINQSLEQLVLQRTEKLNDTIHQLNKTIKELDAFVYSASHDLIAPLKSVMGLIALARKENNNTEVSQYIDHIELSVKKLEDVILTMIQYSQNSNLAVQHEEVNVFELVEESFSEIRFLPGIDAIHFKINIAKDAIVMTDRNRLKIILHNLIGNSVKYQNSRNTSKEVRITFEKGKTIWKLEIYDNGIGIDKQYLSRVFELFFRATDRSKGSGLGLYIVKETVERLYGEIYVDSELGKWTRFTIAIPHENIYLRKK